MYFIGIDLGGTNIASGIVTEDGRILAKKSIPTFKERTSGEIIEDMATACISLLKENAIDESDIASIGIGSPGIVDASNGIIRYASNLNFVDVNIRGEMQKYINLPVFVENDANCAALGEATSGASRGLKDSITVTLGTGVGGGIIVNGGILGSMFCGVGEVGHHVIRVDGEQCTCGRKGCWEAYASASALIRDTKRSMQSNPDGEIHRQVNGDISKITAKTPFDAADNGDTEANRLINEYIKYVAEGITNLINIFQPEMIVIGGGVCSQGERIRKPINDYVDKLTYGRNNNTKLVIAELGNDAGIIGAAMLR